MMSALAWVATAYLLWGLAHALVNVAGFFWVGGWDGSRRDLEDGFSVGPFCGGMLLGALIAVYLGLMCIFWPLGLLWGRRG